MAIMTDSLRPSLSSPSGPDSSPEDESSPSNASSLPSAQPDVPAPFRDAVAALQKQVRTAEETIRALRAENQRLREQVDRLSKRPDVTDDDAFARFDEDRDALRQQIQHFIDAIDDHLATTPASGVNEPASGVELTGGGRQDDISAPSDSPERPVAASAVDGDAGESDAPQAGKAKRVPDDALIDGLPDAEHFEVEALQRPDVAEQPAGSSGSEGPDAEEGSAYDTDDNASSTDASPTEPRLIAPGLSPRRSGRRRRR